MDTLNDFILFLIEQMCVEEYFRNLENAGKDPEYFFNNRKPDDWIFGAFGWLSVPEKSPYWSTRHKRWIERLEDNGYTE